MLKEELLKTARNLPQVEPEFVSEYGAKLDVMVRKMNAIMEARLDIQELVGETNLEMMKDNHANHARFMESVFLHLSPETLLDTVLWVFRAYRSRNFKSTYWSAQLNTWVEIYRSELTPDCFKAIYPYYSWMQVNIPSFTTFAESDMELPLSSH